MSLVGKMEAEARERLLAEGRVRRVGSERLAMALTLSRASEASEKVRVCLEVGDHWIERRRR